MLFQVKTTNRKPKTELEAHLIEVAKTMCDGDMMLLHKQGVMSINTLERLQTALRRERDLYCADNANALPATVVIKYLENGAKSQVWITAAGQPSDQPTAIISLTPEGIDQKEIQDILLIPIR